MGLGGGVILQRGEEKWETGRRRQHSVLRFHRGHVLVGTPHPTRTPAVPTQHPDPRPGSRPSPAQEPQNPPLSLFPAPQQAQASLLFTVPPSPQPSSRLQHPALSTSSRAPAQLPPTPNLGVPSSQSGAQEKNAEGGCLAAGSRLWRQLGLAGGKESHNQAENPQ